MEPNQMADLNFQHNISVKLEQLGGLVVLLQNRQRELISRERRGDITSIEQEAESASLAKSLQAALDLQGELQKHAGVYLTSGPGSTPAEVSAVPG